MNNCPRDGSLLIQGGQSPRQKVDPTFEERYEFIGAIGSGGMGVIYKARHLVLNRIVAVKMLHTNLASSEAVQRFQAEGKLSSLLSHPNIVKVHDLGVTASGQPYMVMDFVEGQTLDHILKKGPLEKGAFLRIFAQLCSALAHAHRKSVLHRDIKPGNIMVSRGKTGQEEVHILDFGIAKILTDTNTGAAQLTKTGEAIGSPIYMSPEQSQGTKLDHRSDLYSLGCVMYECICGDPPLLGKNALETMMMHSDVKPRTLKEVMKPKKVDPRQEKIVMRLLEKKPEDRFQSADDVGSALAKVRETGGLGYSIANKAELLLDAWKKRRDLIYVSAATVIVAGTLIVGLLMYFIGQNQNSKIPLESVMVGEGDLILASTSRHEVRTLLERVAKQNPPRLDLNLPPKITMVMGDTELGILRDAHSLRSLNLRQAGKVDDHALTQIEKLPLVSLNISYTGVRDLTALKDMHSLKSLDCSDTHLSANGMTVLSQLTNLENLNLEETSLKDDALKYLYGLTNLKKLNLTSTLFTEEGVAELRKRLPNTDVTFTAKIAQFRKDMIAAREDAKQAMSHKAWEDAVADADSGLRSFLKASPSEREQSYSFAAELQEIKGEALAWQKKFDFSIKVFDHGIESATKAKLPMLIAQLRVHKERVLGAQMTTILKPQASGQANTSQTDTDIARANKMATAMIQEHAAVSALLMQRQPADSSEKELTAELLLESQLLVAPAYVRMNQPEKAQRELNSALIQLSRNTHSDKAGMWLADMLLLGDCYYAAKSYSLAMQTYQQACQVSNKSNSPIVLAFNSRLQYGSGRSYFALGRYAEADKCFMEVLQKQAYDRGTKIFFINDIIKMYESKKMTERANFYKAALSHI